MKHPLALCLLLLALAGCNPLRAVLKPSPGAQLATLLAAHPELVRRDTVQITVHDTVRVPRLEVLTRYLVVPNPAREGRDSLRLDGLLARLGASLDTAQRKAATRAIYRLVRQRPYFPDTLRFDTLGIHGRIWQPAPRLYTIRLTRDAIRTPYSTTAVVYRRSPCDCNRPPRWYQPGTWPRWACLLAGFLAGILLCFRLARR